ncbi:hypothetical protein SJAV_18010 [Sulfurisphaera javensis]|uniref:MFS transporter n=1 Tax=Sulfurisphaera javensis TaxID=2049879 RepID=A0AAT9GSR4_9CREN
MKNGVKKVFSDKILRGLLFYQIVSLLPLNLIFLFVVFLIYYVLKLSPLLLGLTYVLPMFGSFIGNFIAYKTKIKNKFLLALLLILPDFSPIAYYFVKNVEELFLAYLVFIVSSIIGSYTSYYTSLAIFKIIPEEVFATTDSVISSISSVFDYAFTVLSSIIISFISYHIAVIIGVILMTVIDLYFVPTFWIKIIEMKEK